MRIGIDLGGTKTEFIALSNDGETLLRRRRATPAGDYDATIETICAGVREIEAELSETGTVGIGIPGSLSPRTGRVRNANSTWLNGKPLDSDIAAALGREVRLANDANCFVLSEAVDGAARGARTVFGVILGTGVGGGIAVSGEILEGRNLIAGEWGHNPVPQDAAQAARQSRQCWCGRRDCIETWLSGPGFERSYADIAGESLSAASIMERAESGSSDALRVVSTYEVLLARALSAVINVLDPDVIVLGGGMSNIARLYRNIPAILKNEVFSDGLETLLLPPEHGDSSGVRGAAWL